LKKKYTFFWLIIVWLNFTYCILLLHLNQSSYSFNSDYNINNPSTQNLIKANTVSQFQVNDLINLNKTFVNTSLTGKNSTIAIFDTGIYPYHEVFTYNKTGLGDDKIIAFYDAIEQKEKNPEDIHWHGTYVSSIAAGNSSSYLGIAPGAKLVGIKVFEISEEENELVSSLQAIENGIKWILENKNEYNIKVVSMSFGLEASSDRNSIIHLNSITESLVGAGIVVVAAVGNDGEEGTGFYTIKSPADAKSVISVGGVDLDGTLYSKSSKGPSSENIIKPDISAPAISIFGAFKDSFGNNRTYTYASGTSAATPMVAGLVALMLEKNYSLNPLEVKSILSLTSTKTINTRTIKDNLQGWGTIQGYAALEALEYYINFENKNSISIFLGDSSNQKKVWCRRISLKGGIHYFFDLSSLSNAEAELYIFEINPNYYGEPILAASTINQFDFQRRCGIFVPFTQEYFLVVKLIFGTGSGNFLVSIIFDYRLLIVGAISILMITGIIYMNKTFKNYSIKIKKYYKMCPICNAIINIEKSKYCVICGTKI